MFNIEFFGTVIGIDNRYPYIEEFCRDYISYNDPDIVFSVTDTDLKEEDGDGCYREDYLESLAIYRKIANYFIGLDGFLLHCAMISYKNHGIAFAAHSGVGKSTHIMLWKELLGEELEIINGDKPIVKFIDSLPFACGTPWSGKEGYNLNKSVRLYDICFLERSAENYIKPLSKDEAVKMLLSQVYMPKDTGSLIKTLELIDLLVKNVNTYIIGCNMELNAAKLVYNEIFGRLKNED